MHAHDGLLQKSVKAVDKGIEHLCHVVNLMWFSTNGVGHTWTFETQFIIFPTSMKHAWTLCKCSSANPNLRLDTVSNLLTSAYVII